MQEMNIFGTKENKVPENLNKYFKEFDIKSSAPFEVHHGHYLKENVVSSNWLVQPDTFKLDVIDSKICSLVVDHFTKSFGAVQDIKYGALLDDDFMVGIDFKDEYNTSIKYKYDGDILFLDLYNSKGFSEELADSLLPSLKDLVSDYFKGIDCELH